MGEASFFGFPVDVPVWLNMVIVGSLTILAGMMAGLIMCVFSLDVNRLKAMTHSGSSHDAFLAKRVLLILDKPHWLLITLLLWDDLALEMMPLLLNMFLHPVAAVVVSVTITLVFCEIIPQAVFIHHAFTVSAYLAPFVYALMWISSPIAWPVSKLLDVVVGDKEAVFFQRRELREVIRMQEEIREQRRNENSDSDEGGAATTSELDDADEDLSKEELTIMLNVLSLSESTAKGMLQVPLESMFTLHVDAVITQDITDKTFDHGYGFIPVYEDAKDPKSVTHVLMAKALLLLVYRNEGESIRVRDLPLMPLASFPGETQGTEVFLALQDLSPAIAAITENAGPNHRNGATTRVVGILTLRNIIELIHQATFKAELDPRNPSPMQLVMRSWKVFRRVSEFTSIAGPESGSAVAANYGRYDKTENYRRLRRQSRKEHSHTRLDRLRQHDDSVDGRRASSMLTPHNSSIATPRGSPRNTTLPPSANQRSQGSVTDGRGHGLNHSQLPDLLDGYYSSGSSVTGGLGLTWQRGSPEHAPGAGAPSGENPVQDPHANSARDWGVTYPFS